MKQIIMLVLVTTTVSVQAQENVKTIIEQYTSRLSDTRQLSYHFHLRGEGSLIAKFQKFKGQVKIVLPKKKTARKYIYASLSGTKEGQKVQMLSNKQDVYSYDFTKKIVWHGTNYRNGEHLFQSEPLAPLVLFDEIKTAPGQGAKLLGKEIIKGVACYKIFWQSPTLHYTWWFGINNRFLYQVKATSPAMGDGGLWVTMYNIQVSNSFSHNDFKFQLPTGFSLKEYTGVYPFIGSKAPNWQFKTYDGKTYTSNDFEGKIVVIDFWATWCRPCIMAMPHMKKLHQKYPNRVKVLALTLEEKGDPIAFVKKKQLPFIIGKGESVAKAFKCGGLPFTIIVDAQGKVADYFVGYKGAETDQIIDEVIEKCLQKSDK